MVKYLAIRLGFDLGFLLVKYWGWHLAIHLGFGLGCLLDLQKVHLLLVCNMDRWTRH